MNLGAALSIYRAERNTRLAFRRVERSASEREALHAAAEALDQLTRTGGPSRLLPSPERRIEWEKY